MTSVPNPSGEMVGLESGVPRKGAGQLDAPATEPSSGELASTHTRGPWRAETGSAFYLDEAQNPASYSIASADDEHGDGYIVAIVLSDAEQLHAQSEANARLIAAAPDLYEALEYARDFFREMHKAGVEECRAAYGGKGQFGPNTTSGYSRAADKCDAALSKARGEA